MSVQIVSRPNLPSLSLHSQSQRKSAIPLNSDCFSTQVNNAPVPWSTPGGERLRNSLILSQDAKKFAVARELHGIQSDPIISHALVPSVAVTIAYTIALGINKRLNLYIRPRSLRLCLYGLASVFGYTVYILGKDMGNVKKEADGDETVGKMGKTYAAGGVEFYEKVLERNIALRELMGKDGEGLFTVMGNDEVSYEWGMGRGK